MKNLQGQIAIVTGAGGGFGEGIARLLAERGASVVVADIRGQEAERVTNDIMKAGGNATVSITDVTKNDQVAAMVKLTLDSYGKLDIMVNNAGTTHKSQPLLDVDEATFDLVFAVNVKSLYLSAQNVVPVFKAQGHGTMINIASTAGVRPRPGLTWYNGSKGAAILITKSMAVELAPHKIRVCAVNPVMGETGLIADFLPGGQDTPEARAKVISGIPLGRLSRPLDVAKAVAFLASEEADFITGVCLEVDGGRCI
jgi:3-oxoacyl-[acyl-carrier protein] reductase